MCTAPWTMSVRVGSKLGSLPGGPTSRTPFGMRAPTAVKRSGRFKNSTTWTHTYTSLTGLSKVRVPTLQEKLKATCGRAMLGIPLAMKHLRYHE